MSYREQPFPDPTRPTRVIAAEYIRSAEKRIEEVNASLRDGIFVDLSSARDHLQKARAYLAAGDFDNTCLQARASCGACHIQEAAAREMAFNQLLRPLAAAAIDGVIKGKSIELTLKDGSKIKLKVDLPLEEQVVPDWTTCGSPDRLY